MNVVVKLAEVLGFWKKPYKKAATDLAEMTLSDIFYWVYKCTNPIIRWEDNERLVDTLAVDKSIIGLPPKFEKRFTATIGAAGDLLQAEGLELSKDVLYEKVSDLIFDQDISYANFESPITNQPLVKEVIGDKAPPIECCSRAQFDVLTQHKGQRFNVLNTANNHTFDMGIEGLEKDSWQGTYLSRLATSFEVEEITQEQFPAHAEAMLGKSLE